MNAQQLKNSILQEAIEGRLIPQDPNDEPASVLLERIRKEKKRLVKEGKLKKKDLEEIPISKEEIPFDIPESWEWVKLGNVSEIARGGSPRPIKEYLTEDISGLNWIKIGDTDKGGKYINSCKERIKPEGLNKTRMVHPGDFLLTNSMSFGRPYITNIEGCIHDGWLMISPYAKAFDQLYLYYVLSSAFAHKQFSDKVAGAVVQNLNSDKVADSLFPLPPLAEQHRIVAKIEELLPEVEGYGEGQETLDKLNAELPEQLKKSILQEAIEGHLVPQDPNDEPASVLLEKIRKEKKRLVKEGKLKKKDLEEIPISKEEIPFEIPESWEWVRASDVVNVIMGQSPDGNDVYEAKEDSKAYEFHQGKISFTEKYIASSGKWCKNPSRIANINTLLVCVRAPIGDVNITLRQIGIGRGLAAMEGFGGIQTLFLFFWVLAHKRCLVDKGTGSTFKAITVDVLRKQPFPLPPLQEQHRIVAKIEQLLNEINKLKE